MSRDRDASVRDAASSSSSCSIRPSESACATFSAAASGRKISNCSSATVARADAVIRALRRGGRLGQHLSQRRPELGEHGPGVRRFGLRSGQLLIEPADLLAHGPPRGLGLADARSRSFQFLSHRVGGASNRFVLFLALRELGGMLRLESFDDLVVRPRRLRERLSGAAIGVLDAAAGGRPLELGPHPPRSGSRRVRAPPARASPTSRCVARRPARDRPASAPTRRAAPGAAHRRCGRRRGCLSAHGEAAATTPARHLRLPAARHGLRW